MPPVSGSRFSVSWNSMNFTPLIQVVIFGGLPSMRARSSFHSPCFQNVRPFRGCHRARERLVIGHLDLGHLVEEFEIAHVRLAADSLAVNAHQVAARVIVDHGLIALAPCRCCGGIARYRGRSRFSFPGDFEVAVLLLGDDDAAVAGNVLAADDRAILNDPFPAASCACWRRCGRSSRGLSSR